MISLVLMDASDTLLASGKGVRWPRHDGVHPRVQAGGGGAVGDKRAPPDADRRRARHPALAAAALAEVDPRPWLEADDPAGRHHACPAVASAGGPSPADLASENAWLQRELERARAERDILARIPQMDQAFSTTWSESAIQSNVLPRSDRRKRGRTAGERRNRRFRQDFCGVRARRRHPSGESGFREGHLPAELRWIRGMGLRHRDTSRESR